MVFGHVLRGLEAAGEAEGAAWVGAADLALYSFHMPLFFFLAGLNVRAALARREGRIGAADSAQLRAATDQARRAAPDIPLLPPIPPHPRRRSFCPKGVSAGT